MTLRRTLILLTVVAVAILAIASWWRSGHDAPLTAPSPPPEVSTTSIPGPTSQTQPNGSPSSLTQETPSPTTATPASSASPTLDLEDQAQVSPKSGTTPSAQTGQAREQWRPVLIGFGRAYVSHRDNPAAWREGLSRYSTPAVRQVLAKSSSRQAATHSAYDSYEVLEYHDHEVIAQVNYADGTALVLYVAEQDDGQSWVVRAFDQLAE